LQDGRSGGDGNAATAEMPVKKKPAEKPEVPMVTIKWGMGWKGMLKIWRELS
jgi:hypothetical protein